MPELSLDKVAWIHLDADGRVLTARNAGVDLFYFPGGQREPGESDLDTLVREVAEELTVDVDPASVEYVGTFEEPGPTGTASRRSTSSSWTPWTRQGSCVGDDADGG